MTGDRHVRFSEGVGVKFPRATQRENWARFHMDTDLSSERTNFSLADVQMSL